MEHRDGLDLTAALRLLSQAGWSNPITSGGSETQQLQRLIDALCDLSSHDGLTGLVNATFFRSILARELDRVARTGRPCALLLLDLDHFKAINDTHGHPAGDLVLRNVARTLQGVVRSMDTAARAGGEEFAVILPECTPSEAVRVAQRLHQAISPVTLPIGDITITVTASAGLAWTDGRDLPDAARLVAQADQELYRAKRLGRRRLCHPALVASHVLPEERASLLAPTPEDTHAS